MRMTVIVMIVRRELMIVRVPVWGMMMVIVMIVSRTLMIVVIPVW